MSLSYDLTQVAQSTKDEWSEKADPELTEKAWGKAVTVIQWCMATGIGEITEKNVAEWYARYLLLCASSNSTVFLSLTDVRKMIGLKTNVSKESIASLTKRAFQMTLHDVEIMNERAIKNEKELAERKSIRKAAMQAAENWANQTDPGAPNWEDKNA